MCKHVSGQVHPKSAGILVQEGVRRKLIRIALGRLIPDENNPRLHPEAQIYALCRSYKAYGVINPILIDEQNHILAGHGRYEAALRLKLDKVPAIRVTGLSAQQKKAYRIADNKIALMSGWDREQLKIQIEDLVLDDFDIEATGFSTAEIDIMLDDDIDKKDLAADDLKESDLDINPLTQKGDIWVLGPHKIICGDSLKSKTYRFLLEGETSDLIVSDPPYNVAIDGHVCGSGKIKHEEFSMASGEMSAQEFTRFLRVVLKKAAKHAKPNATAFYFMDWRHMREIMDAADPVYGRHKQLCVWVKDNGGMGSFYRSRHELIFVFLRPGEKGINNFKLGQHGRYRTNVWEYPGVNTFKNRQHELLKMHPTVKPVSMIADIIRDCSHKNQLILDMFSGSGTTLLAAERTGRKARLIEYEPKYVDVTLQRWRRVTGQTPILQQTGETFHDVLKARKNQRRKDKS